MIPTINITHTAATGSIYSRLAKKLGRNPTNAECREECQRIMSKARIDMAGKGKLPHQRK